MLRFDQAASKPNGADADGVLGAPDLASITPLTANITASGFSGAIFGLTVDAAGNLYVSDSSNRRILRFDHAASKANGAAADGVLGAPDLSTAGSGTPAATNMSNAVYGIDVLADGSLYAADFSTTACWSIPTRPAKPMAQPPTMCWGRAISPARPRRPAQKD